MERACETSPVRHGDDSDESLDCAPCQTGLSRSRRRRWRSGATICTHRGAVNRGPSGSARGDVYTITEGRVALWSACEQS